MPAAPRGLDPAHIFHRIPAGGHVALAVSGGSDSMALLRLAAAWRTSGISGLTVDHGLRPESALEAKRVAAWCADLGLRHETLVWQGLKPSTGLQAKAREARYDLMTSWCQAHGAGTLLTAHTMDDQAETVLMRLARTTSFDSLAGIPAIAERHGLRLFRPLLQFRRADLRGYLRDLGQEWIDDPSNLDERFERVRIRKTLPVLDGLGITVEGLSRLADTAREVSAGLWGATEDWVKGHVRVYDTGYCTVPLRPFFEQSKALKTRILGWLIARLAAGAVPEPGELALLASWVDAGGSRRTLGGALIGRRKDCLIIGREPGRIGGEALILPESGKALWDRRFEVRSAPGSRVQALGVGTLPRARELPAFVQQALPAITLPDGSVCVPHLGQGQGATATFRAGFAG